MAGDSRDASAGPDRSPPSPLPMAPDDPPLGLGERLADALARLEDARDRPGVVAAAASAVALLVIVGWWLGRTPEPRPIDDLIPSVRLETTTESTAEPTPAVVHVAGAVEAPGVYQLDASARVIDAIDAAGGATLDADLNQLNMAALVTDGMQIRVPVEGEVLAAPSETASPGPIDLNRATATQLESLPGVGPATAEAIVAHRDERGPFLTIDDLLDVAGIGPAKLAAIADLVVVR